MPRFTAVPDALRGVPVTTQMASQHGIGRGTLAGPGWQQLFRGVHLTSDTEPSLAIRLRAALLLLPPDTIVSHTSAMRLYGFEPAAGRHTMLELSTNGSTTTALKVLLHRRGRTLRPIELQELPVTDPERTFVDCALRLSLVERVQLGDHLVHTRRTTIDRLAHFAHTNSLHGVLRARRTMPLVRAGAESPRETIVRLMLVLARLPEPECNVDLRDEDGHFLARGDLVLPRWKVLIEYDGWHHERDANQRVRDIVRRERLEAAGWRVLVITAGDIAAPRTIPTRVHAALEARGYTGPAPVMSIMWDRWFPTFEDNRR